MARPETRLFGIASSHSRGAGPLVTLSSLALALFERVLLWQDRANQRLRLRAMPDAALKDIGISRLDAEREAGKPFWRA